MKLIHCNFNIHILIVFLVWVHYNSRKICCYSLSIPPNDNNIHQSRRRSIKKHNNDNNIIIPSNDIHKICTNRKIQIHDNNKNDNKSSIIMNRKEMIYKSIFTAVAFLTTSKSTFAAETIGKDPNCNDGTCLGVWDGLLADCPHSENNNSLLFNGSSGAGCTSSQDDTPGIFAEPWDYSEAPSNINNDNNYEEQMKLLIITTELISSRRGDKVNILYQEGRYIKFLFQDGKTKEQSIGEFYFTPNDTTVQFRVGTLNNGSSASGGGIGNVVAKSTKNFERCEMIRKELRYQKVPVLRNRKRTLFFVESDFDRFGPSLGAAGEDIDAKMNIDEYPTELVQSFPMMGNKK